MCERSKKINRLITTFKSKMAEIRKNPTAKNSDTITADSALWYLEATINYSHGFPNEYYEEFQTDTLSLTIQKNSEGKVNLTELTQKYDQMKSEVSAVYHASDFTDKGLAVVDLEKVSENDAEIIIRVNSTTGKINPNPDTLYTNAPPFGPLDNWYYGEFFGHCNGTNAGEDAASKLTQKIQNYLPSKGNGNFFYIEENSIILEGGDIELVVPESAINNHLDYYLYYSIDGTPIPWNTDMLCIPYQDMNTYYAYLRYLIDDYIPNEIIDSTYSSHTIVTCDIQGINNSAISPPSYYHEGVFLLGEKIFSTNEPTEIQ